MATLPQTVRIREIRDDTRTIRTLVLDAAIPEAQAGQFVMLWLPGVDEKPMSIADAEPLTVTIARAGPFTEALHQRKVGDLVGWRGPYGRGFSLHASTPALLVSGGCGVGPLHLLARQAVERGIPVTAAIGARSAGELPYREQFRALGVDLHLATDDGSAGHHGYVTELAGQLIEGAADPPVVYACGPEGMLVALHRLCRERNVRGQLSLERYMKCGFGVCGQCSLNGYLVCQDGPVFDVEQLDDLRDFGQARRTATGRRLPIR